MYNDLIKNINENNKLDTILKMSSMIESKNNPEFRKFVFKHIETPNEMILFLMKWNASTSNMLSNSIRRAFRDKLETVSIDMLLNSIETYPLSIKNLIRMCRPNPFMIEIDKESAEMLYDRGYNIYSEGNIFNKKILYIEFDKLNLNDYFTNEQFKFILDNK